MRITLILSALLPLVVYLNIPSPDDKNPRDATGRSKVVRERVKGDFRSPGEELLRITGKVKVVDAHTLLFEDGTEVELNGGMDAPDLKQKGLIGDSSYPCGKEAAEFFFSSS